MLQESTHYYQEETSNPSPKERPYYCQRVKMIRESLGMTQNAIASFLKVDRNNWYAWENGYHEPSAGIKKLLTLLYFYPHLFKKLPHDFFDAPLKPDGAEAAALARRKPKPQK